MVRIPGRTGPFIILTRLEGDQEQQQQQKLHFKFEKVGGRLSAVENLYRHNVYFH